MPLPSRERQRQSLASARRCSLVYFSAGSEPSGVLTHSGHSLAGGVTTSKRPQPSPSPYGAQPGLPTAIRDTSARTSTGSVRCTASRTSGTSRPPSPGTSAATAPCGRLARYSARLWASRLAAYVETGTVPATAARTAATAGAVRPRLRTASRRARRGESGSQRLARPNRPTRAGVMATTPSSAMAEPAATRTNWSETTEPYRAMAAPSRTAPRPISGSTRLLRRTPRRPVREARTVCREAVTAGTIAESRPVRTASAAMASSSSGLTVKPPNRCPM